MEHYGKGNVRGKQIVIVKMRLSKKSKMILKKRNYDRSKLNVFFISYKHLLIKLKIFNKFTGEEDALQKLYKM